MEKLQHGGGNPSVPCPSVSKHCKVATITLSLRVNLMTGTKSGLILFNPKTCQGLQKQVMYNTKLLYK